LGWQAFFYVGSQIIVFRWTKTTLGKGGRATYHFFRVRKEVFVCDNCGTRKRLSSSQRHWCEECKTSSPVELRPVRDKRSAPKSDTAETAGLGRRY
jgi:hypothetical protein